MLFYCCFAATQENKAAKKALAVASRKEKNDASSAVKGIDSSSSAVKGSSSGVKHGGTVGVDVGSDNGTGSVKKTPKSSSKSKATTGRASVSRSTDSGSMDGGVTATKVSDVASAEKNTPSTSIRKRASKKTQSSS